MHVDLTPLVNGLMTLAMTVVSVSMPVLIAAALKHLKIANNANLSNKLNVALDAAAGVAYHWALSHEGGLTNVAVHDGALAVGINYVTGQMNDTIKKLNEDPDSVERMVLARLGKLLALDPTVTAGTPPAVVSDLAPSGPTTAMTIVGPGVAS